MSKVVFERFRWSLVSVYSHFYGCIRIGMFYVAVGHGSGFHIPQCGPYFKKRELFENVDQCKIIVVRLFNEI
jgi:hypothetical protein